MTPQINMGIEIEGILNAELIPIEKGGYHDGKPIPGLKGWTAESDSSIETFLEFGNESMCIEFVSRIFKSKQQLFQGLEDFKRRLSDNGTYELHEVICFNKSCGSHIHFSIPGFSFSEKVIFETYPKVRRYFTFKIKRSGIQSKYDIISNYSRFFAEKLNRQLWKSRFRLAEFNFLNESRNGVEWRSLNLLNVRTWQEFFEFWEIVYDCLRYLFRISRKYEHTQSIELKHESEIKGACAEPYKEVIGYKAKKRKITYSNIRIPITEIEEEVFL